MNGDFFDHLDAELAALTRAGAHLTESERGHRRWGRLLRRGMASTLLAVALAASLVSEFPASASGHAHIVPALTADRL